MKRKRRRINVRALCSSENYEASKKVHRDFLIRSHESNKETIEILVSSIEVKINVETSESRYNSNLKKWEIYIQEQISLYKTNKNKTK